MKKENVALLPMVKIDRTDIKLAFDAKMFGKNLITSALQQSAQTKKCLPA
jgi:hypothetical protein